MKPFWSNDVLANDAGFKNVDIAQVNGHCLVIETYFPAIKGRVAQAELRCYIRRYDEKADKTRSSYYYRKTFCGLGDEFIDTMAERIKNKKSEMERMVTE